MSDTPLQMHIVVDGCEDILFCNMLRDQIRNVSLDRLDTILKGIILFHDLSKNRIINQLGNTKLSRVLDLRDPASDVNHHRRKNLDIAALCLNPYSRNCGILDLLSKLSCHGSSCLSDHLSGSRVKNFLCKNMSVDTVLECKLLIELVTANLSQIVTSCIKEHTGDKALCTLYRKRLARTDLLV